MFGIHGSVVAKSCKVGASIFQSERRWFQPQETSLFISLLTSDFVDIQLESHRTISFRFCRYPGDDPQKIKMTRILEELINLTVKEKGVCRQVLSFTEKCRVVVFSIFPLTGFRVKGTLCCTNSIVVKRAHSFSISSQDANVCADGAVQKRELTVTVTLTIVVLLS